MKLFYYKDPIANFGDELNPWIWYSLAPELFDDDDSQLLVGIGTLINDKAPRRPFKYVFGSGVGYHGFPALDDSWEFLCVRGPLSAQRLGIEPAKAITDPAVLLTQLLPPGRVRQTATVSFMPHHVSSGHANWPDICRQAGVNYIDPAADIHDVILQLRQSRLVLAEAMHAAIVADALRVPWIPLVCYDHVLRFKWEDWCQSLKLEYEPVTLPAIWDMERGFSSYKKLKSRVKRGMYGTWLFPRDWGPPIPKTNRDQVEGKVVERLAALAASGKPCLSDDCAHHDSIARLLEKLWDLKRRLS
jgi:succinoglycan biosynthesis protein ExoV